MSNETDDEIPFSWATHAHTIVDAPFSLYPERVLIRPISSDIVNCSFCAQKRYWSVQCHTLPECTGVTFIPVQDEVVVRMLAHARILGKKTLPLDDNGEVAMPLAEEFPPYE